MNKNASSLFLQKTQTEICKWPIDQIKKWFASQIDHTVLKPDTNKETLNQICREAQDFGFYSVCIPPHYIQLAKKNLVGSNVKTISVVGFPLGYCSSLVKNNETDELVKMGVDEIDMVLNRSAVKNADYDFIIQDIESVVHGASNKPVKVILETSDLSKEEIIKTCELSKKAGAQFVKTSTGFSATGAFSSDVFLMRKTVGEDFGVKASGGIRNAEIAFKMLFAGANRLGVSASVSIINEITPEFCKQLPLFFEKWKIDLEKKTIPPIKETGVY